MCYHRLSNPTEGEEGSLMRFLDELWVQVFLVLAVINTISLLNHFDWWSVGGLVACILWLVGEYRRKSRRHKYVKPADLQDKE